MSPHEILHLLDRRIDKAGLSLKFHVRAFGDYDLLGDAADKPV